MTLQPFHVRGGLNADGQRLMKVGDPTQQDDAVNLRTLTSKGGVQFAARLSGLPRFDDPNLSKRPYNGQMYFVKYDLNGQLLNRLYVFDSSAPTTGGIAALSITSDDPGDGPVIAASLGLSDPGHTVTIGTTGKDAVFDLVPTPQGVLTAVITTPGTGYAIGDTGTEPGVDTFLPLDGTLTYVVTAITGADPTGGWRQVNLKDYIKPTVAEGDQLYGQEVGDLELITEATHEALKVWDGSKWVTIVDTDEVKRWIAAGSLFQGVVSDDAEIGALPAPANINRGFYWTFNGAPNHPVTAATFKNGGGFAGALNPGDWIQSDGSKFVLVSGDLLAKSRADSLYSLETWQDGTYEKGSLVNYKGSLWRANSAVLTGAGAPGFAGTAEIPSVPAGPGGVPALVPAVPAVPAAPWTKVPLTAGVHNVALDTNLPTTAAPTEVYLVLNSAKAGGKPGLFSYDSGTAKWVLLGGNEGGGKSMPLTGGQAMMAVGCPIGAIMMWPTDTIPRGWLLCDGQTVSATLYPELAALFPNGKVPDFRGAFLRGAGLNSNGIWGDANHTVLGWQESATGRPSTAFTGTTSSNGEHNHAANPRLRWHGLQNGGGGANLEWDGGPTQVRADDWTQRAGNHTHTVSINGGGDTETRPKNFAINYIIKAEDDGVTLRPLPATP